MYKQKVVCFIDILGFGSLVKLEKPESIHSLLSKIRTAILDWSSVAITQSIDLQITQFSDSIVFSFVPTKHYFMNFHFFKELAIAMVNEGIVFRGGITYGDIYHDKELVFGPAMNEAYRLESKVAKAPRIIIDETAMAIKNSDGKTIRDYSGQFIFKIDDADYSYVDYILDVFPYAMNRDDYYKKLRSIILKGLGSSDDDVLKKYLWMKDRYNEAKEKFSGLNPI